MSGAVPLNPWQRTIIEITCNDAAKAAANGDEDAQLLDDEFYIRDRGSCYVYARPGDNIWLLGLEALQVVPDMHVDRVPTLREPGHA